MPRQEFVDVGKRLCDVGLDRNYPTECWPSGEAVSELAHKIKTLKARYNRQEAPFVHCDLKKYLPNFYPGFVQVHVCRAEVLAFTSFSLHAGVFG